MVNNPPAVQEDWVQSLGWEYPPEEGVAIHSSVLDWRIACTEEPGGWWATVHETTKSWTWLSDWAQWLFSRRVPHPDPRLSCLWSSALPGFWLRAHEVRMSRPSRMVQRWTLMSVNQFPSPPPNGQPLIKEGACIRVYSAQSVRPGGKVYWEMGSWEGETGAN